MIYEEDFYCVAWDAYLEWPVAKKGTEWGSLAGCQPDIKLRGREGAEMMIPNECSEEGREEREIRN